MMIRSRKILNPAGAEAVMKAAEAHATEKGHRVAIAIVDPAGNPMLLKKLPDTQVASSQVAVDKARTAAIFVRPSRVLEEQVSAGRIGALTLRGGVALTGGIPLKLGDEVVGAIGTSGETPDQDEATSVAGSKAKFVVDEVKALTYQGAQAIATAGARLAMSRGVHPVITVVDAEGETIFIWRPDKAQVASVNVATDKARTAAIYRRPSKDFEDQVAKGRASALALARGVPLQGGMPIKYGGQVIGAIGVSGASSADEDQEIAITGARVAEGFKETSGQADVFYAMHDQVEARFKTGGLLLDTDQYKVDAGRRDKPGEVEFHTNVTDIMYVVQGDATVVTGGEMVDSREVKPGEIRATAIKGGEAHRISKGDVLVIPGGVPHQFTQVSKPFLYYVVKSVGG
jgi:glc operon protein GlcG